MGRKPDTGVGPPHLKEIDNETLETFYQPIGKLMVSFAIFETVLNHNIDMLYLMGEGRHIQAKKPRTLEEKRDFMKKGFAKRYYLSTHKERGAKLIAELNPIIDIRHTIAHGYITAFDTKRNKVVFTMDDTRRNTTVQTKKLLGLNQIKKAAADIHRLTWNLTSLARFLHEIMRELHEMTPEELLKELKERAMEGKI
ncbi:hypothetical protein [Dongia sp.]|uniref:hypothetical protein n=1 Tax=Dongia sp. TaxID=1977262 RepID=UPI0035B127A8